MVDELTPDEVQKKVEAGDIQVVDIRQPTDYAKGHIPGAINIPMQELPLKIDAYEWEDEIVVACPIGQSSIQAARLIQSYEGVDGDASVTSMAGGYEAWEHDLEVDEQDASAPER